MREIRAWVELGVEGVDDIDVIGVQVQLVPLVAVALARKIDKRVEGGVG